jgi:NAD(P)-dependent dehydrogenase (short-subunit alcohol dehydrogenase family)
MDLELAGKTAIVTGGSAGIGLACAQTLAAAGVRVAIVARSADRLAAAAATMTGAVPIAADLTEAAEVERVAHEVAAAFDGRIDILVNNAGSAMGGAFATLPDGAFLSAWTLKLLGYIRMTRAVVPGMIARRDGRIVNIVGGAARTPSPGFLPGSTANAAIINFTRGLSKELAPHNVRINAVSPGSTATERAEKLAEQEAELTGKTIAQVREERTARIPMRRMTQPDEIAAMTALLVSDRVASMTGAEVVIDGGSMPGV